MPTLSFIIPAFNAAPTLRDTVASLQAQTLQDWEAIVVNDGSTDATPALAASIDDYRVRVVHQNNRGLAGARNSGLGYASAPLVSFLDADDTIAPTFAAAMVQALGDNDAAMCAYEMVGPENQPLAWTIRPAPHDTTPERLIETNPFAVTGVFRRESLQRLAAQGSVFDPSLRVLEDWHLWLRAAAAGWRWTILDQPLFRYRLMPGLSKNIELMWSTGVRVISQAPVADHLKPRALRCWALRNAARAIANKDAPLAHRLLAECGELTEDDLTAFASALGPAFQRASLVGPRDAAAHHQLWRSAISKALHPHPGLPGILTRFDKVTTDWAAVARTVAAALKPGDIPTVYGMGWNGQALITELAALLPGRAIAWLDDNPSAGAPPSIRNRRISRSELTPAHVVAISPNAASQVCSALASVSARVAWPIEQRRVAA